MTNDINDDKLEDADPDLEQEDIEELEEFMDDSLKKLDDDNEVIKDNSEETKSAGDIGLDELANEERLKEEEYDAREQMRVPSDMRSPGDPNAGDVGISGGIANGDIDVIEIENPGDLEGKEEEI